MKSELVQQILDSLSPEKAKVIDEKLNDYIEELFMKEIEKQVSLNEILRTELDAAIEQKQLSFKVCEQLMENEKLYQKEFKRLQAENEELKAKISNL